MAKTGRENIVKYIMARIKFLLRYGIDLEMTITPTRDASGTVVKEVINGTTKRGGSFEITWEGAKSHVKIDGKDYNFDWTEEKELKKATKLRRMCHRWHDKHYYRDDAGNYVKVTKRASFLGRLFAIRAQRPRS